MQVKLFYKYYLRFIEWVENFIKLDSYIMYLTKRKIHIIVERKITVR